MIRAWLNGIYFIFIYIGLLMYYSWITQGWGPIPIREIDLREVWKMGIDDYHSSGGKANEK